MGLIPFGILFCVFSLSNAIYDNFKIVNQSFSLTQKKGNDFSHFIDASTIFVLYAPIGQQSVLDLLTIRMEIDEETYKNMPNEMVTVAVSNGKDTVDFSVPEATSNGSRFIVSRLLRPILPEEMSGPCHVVITVQTRNGKPIKFRLSVTVLDRGQYNVILDEKKLPIRTLSLKDKLSVIMPLAQRLSISDGSQMKVKVKVNSTDDVCAMVVVGNEQTPLSGGPVKDITGRNGLSKYLFTTNLDLEFRKDTRLEVTVLYFFVMDDNTLCDPSSKRSPLTKKSIQVTYSLEPEDNYLVPITLFLSIFIIPIVFLVAMTLSNRPSAPLIFFDDHSISHNIQINSTVTSEREEGESDDLLSFSHNVQLQYPPEAPLVNLLPDTPSNIEQTTDKREENEGRERKDKERTLDSETFSSSRSLIGRMHFAYFLLPLIAQTAISFYWNASPSECYHNFGCAKPLGRLVSFNHVISNAGYAICALIYLIFVTLRNQHYGRSHHSQYPTGVYRNSTIEFAMSIALLCEAFASSAYHICPTRKTYQFDTPFIVIVCTLAMQKLYASRHSELSNTHIHGAIAAALIADFSIAEFSNYWLLPSLAPIIFSVVIYGVVAKIYSRKFYPGFRTLWKGSNGSVSSPKLFRGIILLLVFVINLVAIVCYCAAKFLETNQIVVFFMVLNLVAYFGYYFSNKLFHREPCSLLSIICMTVSALLWICSLVAFLQRETDWALTSAQSRSFNSPCLLFSFFDWHDVWHTLSALSALSSLLTVSTIDDRLSIVPREKLAVF